MFKTTDRIAMHMPLKIKKTCVLKCKYDFFLLIIMAFHLKTSYETGQQYGLREAGSLEQEDLS